MKTLTKISEKLILLFIMLLVMNVSCTSEEDVLPVQEDPVEQQIIGIDEQEEEEEEEEEVILPVRLAMEMEGHDFSEGNSKIFNMEEYSQESGDVLEVNLVRIISGEPVYYKLPGKGYNEESEYGLFYFLPTEEFNFPRVQVSLSNGNGENYDKVVVLVRNAS
ncbi:hypothetical protein [Arthrospiribacter ruber]|uniref:Uncharacterized protein n=1 Tax=Arthrospiribacter ruber TaxID=2487934 RepID=A0A951J005_9BACT|nr:hypothetical protein [Arthrospiribacter ruber]MBW3468498.1 hypothetical protein [Arthrospiribacter ruber]